MILTTQWMRALTWGAMVASLCGCPKEEPTLSEEPLWQVEGDPEHVGGFFGHSIALGDVNGDGRKDLLVTSPPGSADYSSKDPGRVSIFAGQERFFSKQGVTGTMTWTNNSPRTSGHDLKVTTGNVNGDAYADVLVFGTFGVSVYAGKADLTKVFAEPLFRLPSDGFFPKPVLADFDGDGLDDIAGAQFPTGEMTLYRATPGAEAGPFTAARTLANVSFIYPAGDTNLDGVQDLLVQDFSAKQLLYLGCKAGSALTCDGPLTTQPLWIMEDGAPHPDQEGVAPHPDLDGDGRPELFTFQGGGSFRLHLSNPQGGYSATPVWSMMEDPTFFAGSPYDGSAIVSLGDVNGDGQRHDFVVGTVGRLYLYTPDQAISGDMRPVWAWPRADRIVPSSLQGFRRFMAAAPGDLTGDGHDDLVVALEPEINGTLFPGKVMVFGGGRVPATQTASPPYLPEVKACNLNIDQTNGKPDLSVDGDALARTLFVDRRSFAADSCEVKEGCVPAGGTRRLLRFSTSIVNKGRASAVVPSPQERPDLFVYDECHRHDHLIDFAGYQLRDEKGDVVSVGRKQGFYLVDSSLYCPDASPYQTYNPRTGISPGWADIYGADLPCQWLDITDTPDGEFTLYVGLDGVARAGIPDANPDNNAVQLRVRLKDDTVTVLP
ncbi:lysyl oxidase family protein [Archangium sp.]|uniref:lysyl oxidase family protein n=1 Tax=Archangium sp. TaxID=1872627 RepID=UPI002D4A0F2B|nr:lysyl oxidase family protein [Archangium sp.]HYO53635.1 lysyl oxidase family protein [Archangium sp.]